MRKRKKKPPPAPQTISAAQRTRIPWKGKVGLRERKETFSSDEMIVVMGVVSGLVERVQALDAGDSHRRSIPLIAEGSIRSVSGKEQAGFLTTLWGGKGKAAKPALSPRCGEGGARRRHLAQYQPVAERLAEARARETSIPWSSGKKVECVGHQEAWYPPPRGKARARPGEASFAEKHQATALAYQASVSGVIPPKRRTAR